MQKIIFLGSKPIGYHCLEYLIEQQDKLNFKIIAVLSNDNAVFGAQFSVKNLATKNNINIIDGLENIPECDILYSVQYHQILKAAHINKAKLALNLHMAPLPEYRGCNQFSHAIIDNAKIFGTTIHKMDAKIDHGDLAFETRFDIPKNCWVKDLYSLTENASLNLFKQSLEKIIANNISWTSQETLIAARSTQLNYRTSINALKKIDLAWGAEKIVRHIRATYMPGFEPPYTFIHNQKVFFSIDEGKN